MTRSCLPGPQSEVPVFLCLDGWNGDILCVCLVVQSACPVRWLAVAQWGRLATNCCLGLTAPARRSIPVLTAAVAVSGTNPFLLQDSFAVFPEVVANYVSIRFAVSPFMPHFEFSKFPTFCSCSLQYGQTFTISCWIHTCLLNYISILVTTCSPVCNIATFNCSLSMLYALLSSLLLPFPDDSVWNTPLCLDTRFVPFGWLYFLHAKS